MAIVRINKKIKVRPDLLGHTLRDSFPQALASKITAIALGILPYVISEEDKQFLKQKNYKFIPEYFNQSFFKLVVPRKYTKRLMDSFLKPSKFKDAGGIRFTRIDSDGEERDYYGFPVTMDFTDRKIFLTASSASDEYAKSLGLTKIDQTKRLEKTQKNDIVRQRIWKAFQAYRKGVRSKDRIEDIILRIHRRNLPNPLTHLLQFDLISSFLSTRPLQTGSNDFLFQ